MKAEMPKFPPGRDVPPLSAGLRAEGLAVRPAMAADADFLAASQSGIAAETLDTAAWPPEAACLLFATQVAAQLRAYLAAYPLADFWIVERHARPAGRLFLDRAAAPWRLLDIGLLPEARGNGLGRALLLWVQDLAARAGAAGIDLHVAIANNRATALYRALGFVAGAATETHHHMLWRHFD